MGGWDSVGKLGVQFSRLNPARGTVTDRRVAALDRYQRGTCQSRPPCQRTVSHSAYDRAHATQIRHMLALRRFDANTSHRISTPDSAASRSPWRPQYSPYGPLRPIPTQRLRRRRSLFPVVVELVGVVLGVGDEVAALYQQPRVARRDPLERIQAQHLQRRFDPQLILLRSASGPESASESAS